MVSTPTRGFLPVSISPESEDFFHTDVDDLSPLKTTRRVLCRPGVTDLFTFVVRHRGRLTPVVRPSLSSRVTSTLWFLDSTDTVTGTTLPVSFMWTSCVRPLRPSTTWWETSLGHGETRVEPSLVDTRERTCFHVGRLTGWNSSKSHGHPPRFLSHVSRPGPGSVSGHDRPQGPIRSRQV